jgi:hypothetical protein
MSSTTTSNAAANNIAVMNKYLDQFQLNLSPKGWLVIYMLIVVFFTLLVSTLSISTPPGASQYISALVVAIILMAMQYSKILDNMIRSLTEIVQTKKTATIFGGSILIHLVVLWVIILGALIFSQYLDKHYFHHDKTKQNPGQSPPPV